MKTTIVSRKPTIEIKIGSLSRECFRKAGHAIGMNKKGLILINLGQF